MVHDPDRYALREVRLPMAEYEAVVRHTSAPFAALLQVASAG